MQDIYYEPNYGTLYEQAENGKSIFWRYDGPEGVVLHSFLLREIPLEPEEHWYDIVTPYGYGGPIVECVAQGYTRQELAEAFFAAFSKYCAENRIVSEFVRFHPILGNVEDFGTFYNAQCIRHTLGTKLTGEEDPVQTEFSPKCRKNIRRAMKQGVTWRATRNPQDLKEFQKIYYSTMDRNQAGEYYYFDDAYFENLIHWFGEHLLYIEAVYENKTIAAMICFVYGKLLHVHLSGTLKEYLFLSPAYILRYEAVLWGRENGCSLVHHGGGKSNSPEDSLFLYKKQFAGETKYDFCVGRKIWDPETYDRLSRLHGAEGNSGFFPLYRA